MPTSDSNGLPVFNETDATVLHTMLNTLGSGVSNWFNGTPRFKRVANTTERTALVAAIGAVNITPDNPLLVWRADAAAGLQLEYTTNGTNWAVYDNTDTGWVTFMNAPVHVSGRRVGRTVTIRVMVTVLGITDNVLPLEGGASIIPAGFRPQDTMWGAGEGLHPGVAYTPVTFRVSPGGGVSIIKPTTTTNYLYGSVTYVV